MSVEEPEVKFAFGRPREFTDPPDLKIKTEIRDAPNLVSSGRLAKGTTKKSQPNMRNLAQLVGSAAGQDIVRVRGTESLRQANNYIQKRGLAAKGYTAVAEDIDGDNIRDVIIKDKKGNLVVVNGYTIRNTDLPYRQLYYDEDDEVRKKYSNDGGYKKYIKYKYYNPTYDTTTGEIVSYERDPEEDPLTLKMIQNNMRVIHPKSLSPYQLFTSRFVPALLRYLCDRFTYRTVIENDEGELVEGNVPNVTISFAAALWNQFLVLNVLMHIYPDKSENELSNIVNNDKKTLSRISKSKLFKLSLEDALNQIIPMFYEQNDEFIDVCRVILDPILANWYDKHPDKYYSKEVGNDRGKFADDEMRTKYLIPETTFKVSKK